MPARIFANLAGTTLLCCALAKSSPARPPGQDGSMLDGLQFNQPSGFYESAFDLALSTDIPGAVIYYTTNGATPSPSKGILFSHPISVSTTTIIRAVAVAPPTTVSEVRSGTYLFLLDVLKQTGNQAP